MKPLPPVGWPIAYGFLPVIILGIFQGMVWWILPTSLGGTIRSFSSTTFGGHLRVQCYTNSDYLRVKINSWPWEGTWELAYTNAVYVSIGITALGMLYRFSLYHFTEKDDDPFNTEQIAASDAGPSNLPPDHGLPLLP